MRAVIQRVSSASVEVDGKIVGSCGKGYLILLGVAEGESVTFDKVLAVNGETLSVGAPYVAGATVVATVLKNGKSKKIDVIKYKSKKNEKKKIGHRQDYTKIQIEKIEA